METNLSWLFWCRNVLCNEIGHSRLFTSQSVLCLWDQGRTYPIGRWLPWPPKSQGPPKMLYIYEMRIKCRHANGCCLRCLLSWQSSACPSWMCFMCILIVSNENIMYVKLTAARSRGLSFPARALPAHPPVTKLQTLGLNRSLCSWILDFLTGRSQVVRMGNNTSSPLILNTGAPQGCVLSPLLYSLYTHDCTATHSSNVIVKFADDTTVIGLITDNDETAYREEVSTLTKWCQENHLSLNIDKTKELVVDYRRQSREHTPITIDKTPVERVTSFKFLGVHISEDLTWSAHTDAVLKKAHQRLFFLRRLRKFGTSPRILRSFYTCTVESILTGCITAWFGNSTAGNRRALQRVVRTARHIVGGELPSLQDIYTRRCTRKARRIIKDSSHPSHRLLSLLPSGRRLRSIRSRTSRLRDSFFPQAIRLMNSHK